jgi:MoCo/4Fe-4S cofactor protein with predicted Tat translocation signal
MNSAYSSVGHDVPLDLAAIRARLDSEDAPRHWRSLEQAAGTPEFQEVMRREFAPGASEWSDDATTRREFLKLMAASLALAGASACTRQPLETVVPYVRQPEESLPGVPLYYATAMTLGGFAVGLLAESNDGRPTKIEGNPDHPFSLGATNVFHQAAILELYDPDRSRAVRRAGEVSSWGAFLSALVPALAEQKAKQGAGLRILTETITSPTLAAQLKALLAKYPQARWHQYEPVNRDNLRAPGALENGLQIEAHHDFSKAKVIVSLDADFLSDHPAALRNARQFAQARRGAADGAGGLMNRLYAIEPTPTITGAMADHRLPAATGEIELAARLLHAFFVPGGGSVEDSGALPGAAVLRWLDVVRQDLLDHRGESLVVAGEGLPPIVQHWVRAINHALGNVGRTVVYRPSAEARPEHQVKSLRDLTAAMRAGSVELLVMLGGNPVYNAPVDVGFADALKQVRRCGQLSLFYDETSPHCHWHIPQAHFLEAWSDARAFDGVASIVQPLIEPLYGGKSAHELVEALLFEQSTRGSFDIVRAHWQTLDKAASAPDFEKRWRKMVHDGIAPGDPLPALSESEYLAVPDNNARPSAAPADAKGLELIFRTDPCVWDGRFANNPWLQELPKPVTKLTWDNAALVSPALAQKMNLANEDIVELRFRGRALRAPVWILPGQSEHSVTLHLGYGRQSAGRVGNGQGANAFALRTSDAMHGGEGLEIFKVAGGRWRLATTQRHHQLEGRDHDIYRAGTLEESRHSTNPAPPEQTIYPPDHSYEGYAWGMAIDLNACIGCNACMIACQSENNIPVVGKGQVIRERAMHWIRVDSYYQGSLDHPRIGFQPVPCMHCENAPCEVVCPVSATVHSPEGLNEQIYNRCIGTRYCSNNCPYKVRRFNFLQWADNDTLSYKLGRNPDVSVRSRGVMEKCTYCVQRINAAKITSEKEDRTVRDGEILTACQQACPTEAIIFGDINDPKSRVSKLRAQPRNYQMLAELNTRPRTTYLAKLTNPNPRLGAASN